MFAFAMLFATSCGNTATSKEVLTSVEDDVTSTLIVSNDTTIVDTLKLRDTLEVELKL